MSTTRACRVVTSSPLVRVFYLNKHQNAFTSSVEYISSRIHWQIHSLLGISYWPPYDDIIHLPTILRWIFCVLLVVKKSEHFNTSLHSDSCNRWQHRKCRGGDTEHDKQTGQQSNWPGIWAWLQENSSQLCSRWYRGRHNAINYILVESK